MEKTQLRHVKTGKVIWATPTWLKLAQEMKEMHLWEKVTTENEVAKLKFEVPGIMPAIEPAHELVDVEMPVMEETPVEENPTQETPVEEKIEFQNVVEEKPKKAKNK